jgi:NAD(P)-dependent dehydrogenase (short-subunit alcohol dehydrogenase family)
MDALEGKVAVITGGASGIGRAVATRAAAEGMRLVLADIEPGPLDATASELGAAGAQVETVACDVSSASDVDALRDRTLDRFGAVHLVHNNAGVALGGLVWTVSLDDWRWILGVNLSGVIHGIRSFVPVLIDQGEGHVVNTASVAGLLSPAMLGPYNVTKHGVVTLSETLYRDLQAVGAPIGVSVLCPGFVQTGIARSDRNRPSWAPSPQGDAIGQTVRQATEGLVAAGIDPSVVGDAVIEAVRDDTFYILTHDDTIPGVTRRLGDITDRRAPSPLAVQ